MNLCFSLFAGRTLAKEPWCHMRKAMLHDACTMLWLLSMFSLGEPRIFGDLACAKKNFLNLRSVFDKSVQCDCPAVATVAQFNAANNAHCSAVDTINRDCECSYTGGDNADCTGGNGGSTCRSRAWSSSYDRNNPWDGGGGTFCTTQK